MPDDCNFPHQEKGEIVRQKFLAEVKYCRFTFKSLPIKFYFVLNVKFLLGLSTFLYSIGEET